MVRTKVAFPIDKNSPPGPNQRFWFELYDKDTNLHFKGVLNRATYEEVFNFSQANKVFSGSFGSSHGWSILLVAFLHCRFARQMHHDQWQHLG